MLRIPGPYALHAAARAPSASTVLRAAPAAGRRHARLPLGRLALCAHGGGHTRRAACPALGYGRQGFSPNIAIDQRNRSNKSIYAFIF